MSEPNWSRLRQEMGDNVVTVVSLEELRRDKLLADGSLTAAFDETKHPRYTKGTKTSGKVKGGRFAPKQGGTSQAAGKGEKEEPAEKGADITTIVDQAAFKRITAKATEPDQGDFEWPRPGPEFADTFGEHPDTQSLYTDANGRYLPERLALHDDIIGKFLAQSGMVKQDTPETLFMAGGSGAGKSSVLGTQKTDGSGEFEGSMLDRVPENAVYINPDDIKALLPEYQAMLKAKDPAAASAAHEESSDIAKRLLQTANERGYNVVVDGTGDSGAGKFLQKIEAAQIGGRTARVVMVDIPTDMAVDRAMARAARTGRMVPEQEIRKVHKSVAVNFLDWKDKVDDWELWDNSRDRDPRIVATRKPGGARG